MIEVKKPNGDVYLQLDQIDEMVRIKFPDYPLYTTFDVKIIPAFIEALKQIERAHGIGE